MFINIPDVNQYFKYFNGKYGAISKTTFALDEI